MQRSRMKSVIFSVFHLVNISTVQAEQWGFATSTTTGVRVDFPISFQTVLYGIQESHRADLSSDQKTAVIAGAGLTGFGLYNSGTTGYGFNWLALGR